MILFRSTDTYFDDKAVLENRLLTHFRPGGREKKVAGDSGPTAKFYKRILIDEYAKDGGEELFTKMHCVLISNPWR